MTNRSVRQALGKRREPGPKMNRQYIVEMKIVFFSSNPVSAKRCRGKKKLRTEFNMVLNNLNSTLCGSQK